MIICMNYGTDGKRYIAYVEYHYQRSEVVTEEIADEYKKYYDEVYVIDLEISDDLINEVVLKGCRL